VAACRQLERVLVGDEVLLGILARCQQLLHGALATLMLLACLAVDVIVVVLCCCYCCCRRRRCSLGARQQPAAAMRCAQATAVGGDACLAFLSMPGYRTRAPC
jgi:hypothetical protein